MEKVTVGYCPTLQCWSPLGQCLQHEQSAEKSSETTANTNREGTLYCRTLKCWSLREQCLQHLKSTLLTLPNVAVAHILKFLPASSALTLMRVHRTLTSGSRLFVQQITVAIAKERFTRGYDIQVYLTTGNGWLYHCIDVVVFPTFWNEQTNAFEIPYPDCIAFHRNITQKILDMDPQDSRPTRILSPQEVHEIATQMDDQWELIKTVLYIIGAPNIESVNFNTIKWDNLRTSGLSSQAVVKFITLVYTRQNAIRKKNDLPPAPVPEWVLQILANSEKSQS